MGKGNNAQKNEKKGMKPKADKNDKKKPVAAAKPAEAKK